MPDTTTITTTIDLLADLAADVQACRGWLARIHSGYQITDRERDAIVKHFDALRLNADAALHGARLLSLHWNDSEGAVGDSGSGV